MIINQLTRNLAVIIKNIFNTSGGLTENNAIISKHLERYFRSLSTDFYTNMRFGLRRNKMNVSTKIFCTNNKQVGGQGISLPNASARSEGRSWLIIDNNSKSCSGYVLFNLVGPTIKNSEIKKEFDDEIPF